MNAPAKKLSDIGKQWSEVPGWEKDARRAVPPASPRIAQRALHALETPADVAQEFRRQYEIWRGDHPDLRESDPPPMHQTTWSAKRIARVALLVGGAALATFYLAGVLPSLNSGGFQPAPPPEPVPAKPKTARLEVPPMPVAVKTTSAPSWPEPANAPLQQREETQNPPPEPSRAEASKPARSLAPEEIDLMLKRGEEFVTTGDLAAARLVLERAAKAHDARAAFALASTYDPAVLETMKVVGATGDLELAIMWYERAKQYGSRDAGPRLLALSR